MNAEGMSGSLRTILPIRFCIILILRDGIFQLNMQHLLSPFMGFAPFTNGDVCMYTLPTSIESVRLLWRRL